MQSYLTFVQFKWVYSWCEKTASDIKYMRLCYYPTEVKYSNICCRKLTFFAVICLKFIRAIFLLCLQLKVFRTLSEQQSNCNHDLQPVLFSFPPFPSLQGKVAFPLGEVPEVLPPN